MTRQPVKSSAIASIVYDPETLKMEVKFHQGSVYTFLNVPKEVHADLISSPSIGRHFNNHIQGQYERE